MAMKGMNVAVFMSSVREGRVADRVTRYVEAKLKEKDYQVTIVDPKEFNFPLIDKLYQQYPEGTAPDAMTRLFDIIQKADAFVMVSAEYNNSIPPALTNMLGQFRPETFKYRPSAIVCYSMGPYGGVRAAMQLRMFLAEIQTPSIPRLFPIALAHKCLDERGACLDESLNLRMVGFLDELDWYAKTFKLGRDTRT